MYLKLELNIKGTKDVPLMVQPQRHGQAQFGTFVSDRVGVCDMTQMSVASNQVLLVSLQLL